MRNHEDLKDVSPCQRFEHIQASLGTFPPRALSLWAEQLLKDNMTPEDTSKLDQAYAQHKAGQPALSLSTYRDLQARYPDDDNIAHLMAVALFQTGQLPEALKWVEKAIALAPETLSYRNTMGAIATGLRDMDKAATAFEGILAIDPGNIDAAFNLGNVRMEQGRTDDAVTLYEGVLDRAPDNVDALNNLGAALKGSERRERGIAYLRHAVELQPDNVAALVNLADSLERLNLFDEAAAAIEKLLAAAPDLPVANILAARIERRRGDMEAAATRLERIALSAMDEDEKCRAYFDLGKVRDLQARTDQAFTAFQEANKRQLALAERQGIRAAPYMAEVRSSTSWFTAEKLAQQTAEQENSHKAPVFLVGFPRSGTTLIERMLDAHPALLTTGERSPLQAVKTKLLSAGSYPAALESFSTQEWSFCRDLFWKMAADVCGPDVETKTLVDKMPLNIVDIGLIGRLLPDARIVVSLRDPRDVCLSCYMQQFRRTPAMIGFSDLETTVTLYDEIMGFWLRAKAHTLLPAFEYRYEDLIGSHESIIRDILAFADVPWAPEVLNYREQSIGRDISTPSYENVAEPLYTRSTGRWTRYRTFLEPHLERLQPYVEAFGYD